MEWVAWKPRNSFAHDTSDFGCKGGLGMHGTNKGGRRERIVRLTAADAHACLSASLANTLLCLAFLDGWNSYLTARFDQRVRMVNFA